MRTRTLEQNTAQDFAGLQIDQLSKLRNGNITFEQVKWFNNLSYGQRQELMDKQRILKLISGTLILDALDGKETLARAVEIFPSGISDYFARWGTDKLGIATPETAVQVHELVKDATFGQIIDSLGADLNKLCLTQAQIKNFCKKHPELLRQSGSSTLFFFKVEQRFIAEVKVCPNGLRVSVDHFGHGGAWDAPSNSRVVVPRL